MIADHSSSEDPVHHLRRLFLHARGDVRVDVERGRHGAMAEHLGHDLGVDAIAEHADQCRRRQLLGGGGLEVIAALRFIMRGKIPHYYRNPWFWTVRIAVAAMGGGLAVAYFWSNQINTPLMAIRVRQARPHRRVVGR